MLNKSKRQKELVPFPGIADMEAELFFRLGQYALMQAWATKDAVTHLMTKMYKVEAMYDHDKNKTKLICNIHNLKFAVTLIEKGILIQYFSKWHNVNPCWSYEDPINRGKLICATVLLWNLINVGRGGV